MRLLKPTAVLHLLLFAAACVPSAQAADTFVLGPVEAPRGSLRSGYLDVPRGADGDARIPVSVLHGARPGPVLALVAGTHGYEYPPITALQRLRRSLDPAALTGTVILVHVANPPSFFGRTIYYSPADGKNLNRVYPGRAEGTMSERIAHVITTQVIERADYLVDLHSGDGNEALRPYVYMPVTGNRELDGTTRGMAMSFGIDHIVIDTGRLRDPDDSLYVDQTALTRGKPAITTETGQLGSNDEHWVRMAEQGVNNLLRHLNMLEGESQENAGIVWLTDYQVIASPGTGMFRASVRDGYMIAEGGLVGVLLDLFGDEVAEIRAPFAGVVNYVIATPPVSKGEPVAMVSRLKDESMPGRTAGNP
ncbi:MAG TPA: M14 family metallopeptidase [Woeseiaceae bacterium]